MRISSHILPVWYHDLGLIFIFLPPLLLSACSMTRGQEETSTSQVGRRWGPSRESPSASSIISFLSIDEVRSYCQIPEDINFDLLDGPDEPTVGEEHNAMFFTREHLAVGLRFPVSSLVKQFFSLHQSATCLYSPKRHSDYDRMLRTKPSLPAGPFIGGSLLCLHLEAGAWWATLHVGLEPPTTICYWAPRFAQV